MLLYKNLDLKEIISSQNLLLLRKGGMVMRYDYVIALCPGWSSKKLPKGPSKRAFYDRVVHFILSMLLNTSLLNTLRRELLGFLQQNAILVWGLWTAKSSLLYPHGGTKSLARDYALLLFSKNLNVHSSDVNVRVELDTPVRNCLNIFVLERSNLTGNSELPDESFKILYPNIFGSILLVNFIWFSRHIGFTRL
ncbi:hypothetical protein JHK87_031909 [Glycine soja]|nr:hypothetical protein JHK87_031909 [Glycine soja]